MSKTVSAHGPWFWSSKRLHCSKRLSNYLATVTFSKSLPIEEQKAAERLIAAAPDSHSLIQRLWAFIENGSDSDDFFELRSLVRQYYGKVEG